MATTHLVELRAVFDANERHERTHIGLIREARAWIVDVRELTLPPKNVSAKS